MRAHAYSGLPSDTFSYIQLSKISRGHMTRTSHFCSRPVIARKPGDLNCPSLRKGFPWTLLGHDQYCPGQFPRRHEGTQGPGHFTVRPSGPHSLSPSLVFLVFFGKHHPSYLACRRCACGCRGCFPLPGRGAAPHTSQSSHSSNHPKPLCPLLFFVLFVVKTHWQSCVR